MFFSKLEVDVVLQVMKLVNCSFVIGAHMLIMELITDGKNVPEDEC